MIKYLFNDKTFYKTMIAIAVPITLQNLISSSLNMVDTMMIGRLGETQIAAVGLANQVFFLFALLLFGINSGASIFIAQFWGKRDVTNIRRVMGISLVLGGAISTVFAALAFFFPEFIISIYSKDIEVISLGSSYLRIVSVSYIITAISFAYSFACRSIGEAKLPMVVSAISLGCNTILNYLLIFGNFGFPALGIRGAAIATLISRGLELVLITSAIYSKRDVLAAKLSEMLDITLEFAMKIMKTTLPVILNEGCWALGTTMYTIAYARIGTDAIASVQITNTIQSIFFVVFLGMGNSSAVMIGNQIGANDQESAIDYAKKFLTLGVMSSVFMGVLLVIVSPLILSIFELSQVAYDNSIKILIVLAMYMAPKTFNVINIVGIFRSGGDTKFSLFLEMTSIWLIGVPLAFMGALVWQLPVYWVVALVSMEEIVKAFISLPRILSKKWVRNVVEQMQ